MCCAPSGSSLPPSVTARRERDSPQRMPLLVTLYEGAEGRWYASVPPPAEPPPVGIDPA